MWAAVIATVISAILGGAGTYVLGLWPSMLNWARFAWNFVIATTSVSHWILGVLGLCAALVTIAVVAAIWTSITGRRSPWARYRDDNFFGLRWRWTYVGGTIDRIHTFCPKCDFQVFPHDASSYSVIDRICFKCDGCGADLGSFDETYDSLESKATRFVQQKIRNGTWANPISK